MFAKLAPIFLFASTFISCVISKPVPAARGFSKPPKAYNSYFVFTKFSLASRVVPSFNHWGDISAFDNFDSFYGVDNFDSSVHFTQVVDTSSHLVCHTQAIEVVQQRLLVIQEMAKRIITEQVCEVETQTVVFQQFHASLGLFRNDLHRVSGHQVGFDAGIASHFGNIVQTDGTLSVDNFGFTGHELGARTVVVGGSNWNDVTSPRSVAAAFGTAQGAIASIH